MPLNPSRRDTFGPPKRDLSDLAALVRHHGSGLRQMEQGLQDGRFASLRPVPPGGSQLTGDDGGGGTAEPIRFENSDHAVCSGTNKPIQILLSHVPEEGSEQVYYNGTPLKWSDWYRTDSVLTIPAETWFRAGKTAWVDYAYYEDEVEPAAFDSVSVVTSDHSSIPLPGTSSPGDLLVLVISAANFAGCSDPRFSARLTSSNRGVWVGTDDGLGTPVSILMDSVATSGGADSVAALMRIKGSPLLPTTSDAASSGSGASFSPTIPAFGSFGVMAVASGTGLVRSRISGDVTGNWTAQLIASGDGSSGTSVFLGTATGLLPAQFTQAGSSPDYFAWVGGLQ